MGAVTSAYEKVLKDGYLNGSLLCVMFVYCICLLSRGNCNFYDYNYYYYYD